jgi:hypothetical protein
MTDFPGNSKLPRPPQPQQASEKKIESVVNNEVHTRKKGLLRRFRDVFVGGDSRSVVNYVIMDVLVPQAKDMITEAASQGIERLIYGDSRSGRGRFAPRPPNSTNYTRYAVRGNNPIGRTAREERTPVSVPTRNHGIDEILLATRVEADLVLDRMYDLLEQYESVSVSDLYNLLGLSSNYVDQKWGWNNLQGASVMRTRDGYILNLPKTQSLE